MILHDACYGHRYSRPRTSKASLSTIVERPERILASVLGISTAYILLGGRHSNGDGTPHPSVTTSPQPFTIHKSSRMASLTSLAVTNVHGMRWMAELKAMCEGAESKLAANGKELVRPARQSSDDEQEDKARLHEGDLYLCSESLNALEGALGGVLEAVDTVFGGSGSQRSFVCIRPPGHHCSDTYPSGFCWLNNIHVGISHAAIAHGLTHAAIIDFDLHHGDGSQSIAWDHNAKVATLPKNASLSKKTAIGYFSLHDINSYPCEWGDEEKVRNASLCIEDAHGQNIWNIHLQPWKNDADFWNLYETRYVVLLEKTRAFLKRTSDKLRAHPHAVLPKAAIFISAGFDASEWESHGMQRHKVNVPTDFYARFTQDIVALSDEEGLGVDGRIISVLEGGYSDRALMSGVLSHVCGLTSSKDQTRDSSANGLGQEMSLRLGNLGLEGEGRQRRNSRAVRTYDPRWWSHARLEELESLVNPPLPAAVPKKSRGIANPTYSTPTQSFAAKVVPHPGRRSLSSSMTLPQSIPGASAKASVQLPPPDVDWATASHELSKVLIPNDRQTRSCKPEDLNAEATRARKARQSTIGIVPEASTDNGKKMQLRDRKSKVPTYKTDDEVESRSTSRMEGNRRRTIGGVESHEDALTNLDGGIPKARVPSRRRVSVASTILSAGEDVPSVSSTRQPQALAVPKSRSPSKTRVARKASAQPPVPRVPSSFQRPTATSSTQQRPSNRQASAESRTLGPIAPTSLPDMDNLTSGIKKMNIKLKVPPKEEQEAREAKRKAVSKPSRKSTAPKVPNKLVSLPTIPISHTITPHPAAEIPGAPLVNTIESPPQESSFLPVLSSQAPSLPQATNTEMYNGDNHPPPSFMAPSSSTIPAPISSSSVFDSIPNPPMNPPSLPLTLSPAQPQPSKSEGALLNGLLTLPAACTSSDRSQAPKQVKENIPVFTATSPIVFRPSTNAFHLGHDEKDSNNCPHIDQNAYSNDGNVEDGENSVKIVKKEDEGDGKARVEDIWEVPDTPAQQRTM